MQGSETCVLCGAAIPEGWQVCPICDAQAVSGGTPAGFLSAADVEMLCGLRGNQIKQLFTQYGTQIGGRTYIEIRLFNALDVNGEINRFRAYPMIVRDRKRSCPKGEKDGRVLRWRRAKP